MTLIWAKKINKKWTLLADNAVTLWQIVTDCSYSYRPKLREIEGKNVSLVIASWGTLKDVDYMLNILERDINGRKFKDTLELKIFIQEVFAMAYKELKMLTDDPTAFFLILETNTDTLWICDGYSVTEPIEEAEIVMGSGDASFYKSKNRKNFFQAFCNAIECDEYCEYPITTYRDWELQLWYGRNDTDSDRFYSLWKCNETEEPPVNYLWQYVENWNNTMICSWTNKTL